jgi:hypothetical protein
MNHCIECGKPVTRGRTTGDGDVTRCLVCENARVMRTWKYKSATMRLRERVKELEVRP